MSAVITNSKLATDHLGNASRGPQIGPIAIREWSFEQQSDQAPALRGIQLPRTAGREAHLQRSCSTPSPCIAPVHHRTSIASDAPRHFIQRVTTIQQLQSSLAPIFQEICASLRSGHRCSLLGTPIIALFMHISIVEPFLRAKGEDCDSQQEVTHVLRERAQRQCCRLLDLSWESGSPVLCAKAAASFEAMRQIRSVLA